MLGGVGRLDVKTEDPLHSKRVRLVDAMNAALGTTYTPSDHDIVRLPESLLDALIAHYSAGPRFVY